MHFSFCTFAPLSQVDDLSPYLRLELLLLVGQQEKFDVRICNNTVIQLTWTIFKDM